MRLGIPKSKTENVIVGGKADNEIRSKHEVLYTSDLVEISEGEKYNITHCNETPSEGTCGGCILRYLCNFSEAPKLRG